MNKKHIRITSEINKEEINKSLDEIRSKCYNSATVLLLDEMRDKLNGQYGSSFESCLDTDGRIKSILEDIKKDIKTGSYDVVKIRAEVIKTLIEDRDKLCPHSLIGLSKQQIKNRKIADKVNFKREKVREKLIAKGKPVASTYSAEELYEIAKNELRDSCANYLQQAKALQERIAKNKNDKDAIANFKTIELKLNGARQRLDMLNDEQYRQTLVEEVKLFTDAQKELIAKRKVSDDLFDVMMKNYTEAKTVMYRGRAVTEKGAALFNSGADSTADTVLGEAAVAFAPNSSVSADVLNSPLMHELGGLPDESEEALKEILENIEPTIVALKNTGAQLERDKIKYDIEIEDYEDQLLALKPEYEASNASMSKSVADKIKSINALRLASIRNRDRYIRAKDQLNKQLEMAIGLKGIKDIEIAKRRASDVMGKNFNLENWAMFMKDYDRKENSLLDELEVDVDVANSEDVNLTALPETTAPYQGGITKNDHLFDALWNEIERSRNEGNK